MAARKKTEVGQVTIKAPNFVTLEIPIVGTAPLVSNNFSQEVRNSIEAEMAGGAPAKTANKKKIKEAKDFEKQFQGSLHRGESGEYGMPASSFRAAMIRACAFLGVEMTLAKGCVFIEEDCFEAGTQTPLVVLDSVPIMSVDPVRLGTSMGMVARGRYPVGWKVNLKIRYDADRFSHDTIANIVARAGISVGIGAGRPFSTMSAGQGWGTFRIDTEQA